MGKPKIGLSMVGSTASEAYIAEGEEQVAIVKSEGQDGPEVCRAAAHELCLLADGFLLLAREGGDAYKVDIHKKVNTAISQARKVNLAESVGARLIAAERSRQISAEGWSAEHDDRYEKGELIDAALCYVYAAINVGHPAMQHPPPEWPWDAEWWKPDLEDPLRNFEKAGALIAAEIDRLKRLPPRPAQQP